MPDSPVGAHESAQFPHNKGLYKQLNLQNWPVPANECVEMPPPPQRQVVAGRWPVHPQGLVRASASVRPIGINQRLLKSDVVHLHQNPIKHLV